MNPVLANLRSQRDEQIQFIDQTMARVAEESRDLVDAERSNLDASNQRIAALDAQIAPLEQFEELRGAHTETTSQYVATAPASAAPAGDGEQRSLGLQVRDRDGYEYRSAGEFMADVYRASSGSRRSGTEVLGRDVRDAAARRIGTHGLELADGVLVRAAEPHNTTDEIPGLMPTPIVGSIMSDVDAARPFVSSVGALDLGGIPGLTFERPVVTGHVKVEKQDAEKDEVANRQFKVGGIPFTKDTYGGWANVSRQSVDWSSPGVWDALLNDFIEQYGLETENAAADAFVTAVTQEQELTTALNATATLQELVTGLYGAAVKAYQGSGRMPDHIWASLDWWPKFGAIIDVLKATTAGDGGGDNGMDSFAGNLLRVPRTIVPSFPSGTLIVGVKSRTEVYEDRFGFLSVVQPKVFGVELAYGGYMASGTVKPGAFCKVVNKL